MLGLPGKVTPQKHQMLRLPRKSDTVTSPNAAPATKSDTVTSPNVAPATKTDSVLLDWAVTWLSSYWAEMFPSWAVTELNCSWAEPLLGLNWCSVILSMFERCRAIGKHPLSFRWIQTKHHSCLFFTESFRNHISPETASGRKLPLPRAQLRLRPLNSEFWLISARDERNFLFVDLFICVASLPRWIVCHIP